MVCASIMCAISGVGCGCVDKVRVGVWGLDGEFFSFFRGARSCYARS
jgi:hypothetical protein